MARLRIFGSGRVLLEDDNGKVLDDFVVPDVEKAQAVLMQYLQQEAAKKREQDA
jgi:hypothetical protein